MIEFSEDLSKIYTGKEALQTRIETLLKHTLSDIPYYDRGIDITEFTYGSKAVSLRQSLRDFSPDITVNPVNGRVQIYDVDIDITKLLK
jgi:hypothetical protein